MEWVAVWRFVKWIGLLLWAIGMYNVSCQSKQSRRIKSLYTLAIPGFAVTWMMGWLMMKHLDLTMSLFWISNAMLFGLISMVGTFLRAFLPSVGSDSISQTPSFVGITRAKIYNAMGFVGLLLSLGTMVVRDGAQSAHVGVVFVSLVLGGLAAWSVSTVEEEDVLESVHVNIVQGFKWVARVEGLTVLVLFLLYLPAKKVFGINLDGGTGVIGWTHGVFVILYVLSLTMTARTLKWSLGQYIVGGVSSFFPFGTFVFEHKIFDRPQISDKS